MIRKILTKEKMKILFYMTVYDLLCALISMVFLGFNYYIYIGLAVGTLTAIINLTALGKVIDWAVVKRNVPVAFLVHIGRFVLFGLAGHFCIAADITALVAYGFGVIGLVPALVGVYRKDGIDL